MKLYVKVSEDDLELPEAVAESRAELARMLGYGKNYAYTCMERAKKSGKKPKVVEVEVDENEISNNGRICKGRCGKGF